MSQADRVESVLNLVIGVGGGFFVRVSSDEEIDPLLCAPLGFWFVTVNVSLQLA